MDLLLCGGDMTLYVRLNNKVVQEIFETDGDISNIFHQDCQWIPCPQEGVKVGYVLVGDIYSLKNTAEDGALNKLFARHWVETEQARITEELNKVQDSDPKATGTVSEWRTYRKSLRAWYEQPSFPDEQTKPIAPDSYKE